MKRLLPNLCLAVVLLLPARALLAADRDSSRTENRTDGFEQLFNGKDLRGWKGDTNFWSVQSSNLVGRTTAAHLLRQSTCLIWTNGTLHDFELHLTYRITPDNPLGRANSAILYRSRELTNNPTPFVVAGYQAVVDSAGHDTGILCEEPGRGLLAERGQMTRVGATGVVHPVASMGSAAELQAVLNKNDWNDCTIIARANQLTHVINGRVMVHVTDTQEGARALNGVLALQLRAGEPMTVQFRDIRLKSL